MILADGLIPFLLHLERYLIYEKGHTVGKCHQLHLLLVHLLLSILLDFSLTVKAATLIFISGRGSAISSAKQGNSGFIYNLVKS